MIKGMTGYGSASFSCGKIKGVLEMKSQNHRYFDIVYYLPSGFSFFENKIKERVHRLVKRGRVSVSFKITEKPPLEIRFNKDVIREYLKNARALKKEFKLENNITLADLLKMPGVITSKESSLSENELWPAMEKSLMKAVASLVRMRTREGKSLVADSTKNLKRMKGLVRTIKSRAKVLLRENKKKLTVEEFVTFQKGVDVNEETARLSHYVEEFQLLLKATAGVGKKLDFVGQEMQRETNTIGSKVQDKIISNAVISLKSKIEKLREQAQNIE